MKESQLRDSAAVLLTRAAGAEVYLVERSPRLRFFGGYHAFPGGVVEECDRAAGGGASRTFERCARRELAEETGIAAGALEELTWRTTPDFSPLRYRTCFFHAELPPDQEPRIEPGELVAGRFWRPAEVWRAWLAGDLLIAPPVVRMLQLWAQHGFAGFRREVRREGERLEKGELPFILFSPGVLMAPLRCATLAPAQTTNCLLLGRSRLYLVDPGPSEAAERRRLLRHLERVLAEQSAQVAGVIATHHHRDHSGAATYLATHLGVPLYAHPHTLERLPQAAGRGRALHEGEGLELGRAPDGSPGWQLRALHTPGHARGHLALIESRYGALIAGDICSSLSSVVIDPPEGHMGDYLASLRRLLDEPVGFLYPGHGVAQRDGLAFLERTLEHRRRREEKLLALLGETPQPIEKLLTSVYDDVQVHLHALAARSLLAGLEKLLEEGRAARSPRGWRRL